MLSNPNSVLNATDQLNSVRMSHILICSTAYAHLFYRHVHFGRFMLRLEKITRHLISYRAKPGNPAFLLDGYQRIRQQAAPIRTFHFDLLQMLTGAKQQTCSVNLIKELQPYLCLYNPHSYACNWSGPEGLTSQERLPTVCHELYRHFL